MSNIVPFQEMDQMADAIAKSGLFGMRDKASVLALMAVAQAEMTDACEGEFEVGHALPA